MRKTNRSTRNKGIQKHTSLNRDGVQMRNRPQRMTRYLKEKIRNLSKLSGRDPRIRTSPDRRPSDVWHIVIKGWRLHIKIDRLPNYWNTKSLSHYPRGNGELYTSYPTPNQGVGIINVAREVWVELPIKAVEGGWSISNKGNRPLLLKFSLMVGSNSSNTTFRLAQIFLLLFSFS